MNTRTSGFALVAVLVALSILLMLATPFLVTMGHGEAFAAAGLEQVQARYSAESMRELAFRQGALGHRTVDPTPGFDGLDEFPGAIPLPKEFAALRDQGKTLLSSEVWDLQRRVNLNSSSPLLLANLLGLYARLAVDHPPEADKLQLEDAGRLPTQGHVVVDRELIQYTNREGNTLTGLTRGKLRELGFLAAKDHTLLVGMSVFDYRTVLAVTYQFDGRTPGDRKKLVPFANVDEVQRIGELGFGSFTAEEMDILRRTLTCGSIREDATDWGHAERLFTDLKPGDSVLQVRSAGPFGGGTVLRLRSLDGKKVEHALVWSTESAPAQLGAVNLSNRSFVNLLGGVTGEFTAIDTVVEALIPHPVNVNTAPAEVLEALVLNLRQAMRQRPQNEEQRQKWSGFAPAFTLADAKSFAADVIEKRAKVEGDPEKRPFEGFEDFCKRVIKPRIASTDQRVVERVVSILYRALLDGREGSIEFTTAPLCFASAPVFAYRAAAAKTMGSGALTARHEFSGIVQAMPGAELDVLYTTQEQLEEAFRLDRQAPWYQTWPINTGATNLGDLANPISRYGSHLFAEAFPQMGFGQARFPSRDASFAGFRSGTVNVAPRNRGIERFQERRRDHESMSLANDPDGRDITKQGAYRMLNSGATGKQGAEPAKNTRHDRIDFPLSTQGGFLGRHAISFWIKLEDGGDQVLYDYAGEQSERDRISARIEKGHLVFEVLDTIGLDPEPTVVATQVERSAATWRVPLTDIAFAPKTWYHVSLSAEGTRPGQLTLLVDGVPRGQPLCRTFLAAQVAEYKRQSGTTARWFWEDKGHYPRIVVESTEGFPEKGVLRIGLELFEYTKKDGNAFVCEFDDSFGGRVARMDLREYRPNLEVDQNGRPTKEVERLLQDGNLDVAPSHPAGTAVELYGYTLPIYRDALLQPGSTRLSGSLGAFAIARAVTFANPKPIVFQIPGSPPYPLGTGIDVSADGFDLEIVDPLPDPSAGKLPTLDPKVLAGFSKDGGYALLVQHAWRGLSVTTPRGSASMNIGGVELVRYTQASGSVLKGVKRQQLFKEMVQDQGTILVREHTTDAAQFVLAWNPSLRFRNNRTFNESARMACYVVPVSITVPGASNRLEAPTEGSGRYSMNWVQIYEPGNRESETEWVRYDRLEGDFVIRAQSQAWLNLYSQLTQSQAVSQGQDATTLGDQANLFTAPFDPLAPEPIRRIGRPDDIECTPNGFGAVAVARQALGFRGDTFTGTSSHAHEATAVVLPVHRMELDWGNYGALTGRAGRHDRIGLVAGAQAQGKTEASVEWHSVNWACRRLGGDPKDLPKTAEHYGPWPFQLVGFKEAVRTKFLGPATRDDTVDSRTLDRILKYPSGELPAAYAEEAWFGGTVRKDYRDARATIDEIDVVEHQFPRSNAPLAVVLDTPMPVDARTFKVRLDLAMNPVRAQALAGVGASFPKKGGLLRIDGEVLAYVSHDAGTFEVARSGRGLLGTEPKAHDEGAAVFFLDEMPTAILAGSVSATSATLNVNSLNELPRGAGTVLLRDELLHYCWTIGDTTLEMPKWKSPDAADTEGRGLLRGRYGTKPVSGEGGEAVIFFPTRFWDRYHERADDPELSHFQVTLMESPVWITSLTWDVEQTDPLVQLHCLVRVDGRSPWNADPKASPGLYLFEHAKVDNLANQIRFQGSRVEARFVTKYGDGAFDGRLYRRNSWKTAPFCKAVGISFEGQTRILEERVSAR